MIKTNDSWLDLAYDTLAEGYFMIKDYANMRKYEQLTLAAAPPERKNDYKPRVIDEH